MSQQLELDLDALVEKAPDPPIEKLVEVNHSQQHYSQPIQILRQMLLHWYELAHSSKHVQWDLRSDKPVPEETLEIVEKVGDLVKHYHSMIQHYAAIHGLDLMGKAKEIVFSNLHWSKLLQEFQDLEKEQK